MARARLPHVIAGAWCSMLLADLGADVVKIEPPAGEVTRTAMGPFRAYDFVNRNKRAMAVGYAKADGAAALRRLAAWADVWVENFRPGGSSGWDSVRALGGGESVAIYCSISGLATMARIASGGGLDLVAQAMSGIMSFVANPAAPRLHRGSRSPTSIGNLRRARRAGAWGTVRRRRGATVEATLLQSAPRLHGVGSRVSTSRSARSPHRAARATGSLSVRGAQDRRRSHRRRRHNQSLGSASAKLPARRATR